MHALPLTRLLRTTSWAALLALTTACYTGVSAFDPLGGDDPPAAEPGEDDADDGPLGEDISESLVPDKAQLRLLNADEYRNTIRDLLGVEVSGELDYAEIGTGFDNDSEGKLGDSLFSILQIETERVAAEYVATGLGQDYPCFDPEAEVSDTCVETIVDALGRRAFRRPVDPQTRQQLLDFFAEAAPQAEDSGHAMELLLTRMLLSPRFLYRSEIGQPMPERPGMVMLDPFERASLVSYAVVGSMPDEPLLADAEADRLDMDRIREHVRRLLATDPGRAQVVKFFKQWLRVGELDTMAESYEDYPKLASAEQARTLRDEFERYIEQVVLDDAGTLTDLLTRSETYVDQHTAPLYGASSQSDQLEPLALDPQQRGGVLTLASVMAVHSSSAELHRDKPIRRGLLVKNQLLCEDVGLPSGIDVQSAAEEVLEDVPDFDLLTTREQLQLIMNQSELCIECHSTFMPYGYLWSNFDALGQYQTHFGDRPLDSRVEDLRVDGQAGTYDGVMQLLPELVGSEQVPACFSRNVARYATGLATGPLVDFLTDERSPQFVADDLDILLLFEDVLATPELYIREAP